MEKKYKYKLVKYGKSPILRIEVVSETSSFVTYRKDDWGKTVEIKEKKARNIFDTFEEARAWQEADYRAQAKSFKIKVDQFLSYAGNMKGLKNPYEDSNEPS